jgi:hypothetical protein
MMQLKEERLTITPLRMFNWFRQAGFINIKQEYHIKRISLINWLENNGLTHDQKETIKEAHLHAPDHVKDVYNMKIDSKTHDIFIDVVFMNTRGEKPVWKPV